jgi:hypothetical protein
VSDFEQIADRLRTIEEELRDAAYESLRDAAAGNEQAAADEKRLLQARRAIARAIGALSSAPVDDL